VRAALDIRAAAAVQPAFLATRLGLHCGPVLCREGDYVGRTVNIAARITAQAAPHQLLVSDHARVEASGLEGLLFTPVGRRILKGVNDEIELFDVKSSAEELAGPRIVDPVCGMLLNIGTAPTRVTVDGTEHVFCSEHCLQRFTEDPDRYR
jgi:adenylate cyclase